MVIKLTFLFMAFSKTLKNIGVLGVVVRCCRELCLIRWYIHWLKIGTSGMVDAIVRI